MKTWNYRVIRRERGDGEGDSFQVHEVYYDDAGAITMWSERPIAPYGEDLDVLTSDVRYMLEATDKPVLDHSSLPGALGFLPDKAIVMGFFRHPDFPGTDVHKGCGYTWHDHGWIDSCDVGGQGITVCPATTGPFPGQTACER